MNGDAYAIGEIMRRIGENDCKGHPRPVVPRRDGERGMPPPREPVNADDAPSLDRRPIVPR